MRSETHGISPFPSVWTLGREIWPLTTLRDRLVKIGAKIVRHGRSITFQMAEASVPRDLFQKMLGANRPLPLSRC
jgi:hypothetical protein